MTQHLTWKQLQRVLASDEEKETDTRQDKPEPLVSNNLKFHVENMTPQQLEEARHTIEENPNIIAVVDRNANTDSIKFERIDSISINEKNNQSQTNTRKSSRLISTNPINRYGNPITL